MNDYILKAGTLIWLNTLRKPPTRAMYPELYMIMETKPKNYNGLVRLLQLRTGKLIEKYMSLAVLHRAHVADA